MHLSADEPPSTVTISRLVVHLSMAALLPEFFRCQHYDSCLELSYDLNVFRKGVRVAKIYHLICVNPTVGH